MNISTTNLNNLLPFILQGIQAALAAAPDAAKIVAEAKALFGAMFSSKLITAAEQNKLNDELDKRAASVLAGQTPPAWVARPDPK